MKLKPMYEEEGTDEDTFSSSNFSQWVFFFFLQSLSVFATHQTTAVRNEKQK